MKQKPLKPSPPFLIQNSKRNSFLLTGLIISIVALFGGADHSEIYSLHLPVITYHFIDNDSSSLLSILNEGSSSRISFFVEIRSKKHSSPFNSKSVYKKSFSYTASRNLISREFLIKGDDGSEQSFTDSTDFLNHFLSFQFKIPEEIFDSIDLSADSLKIRGILVKRVYVEPFHIFQLFDYKNRISKKWTIINLEQEENAD